MDPIATGILTAAGGAVAAKIFDGPFKSLEDFWFSHFGYKVTEYRIKKEAELEAYRQSIINNLSKIPEEEIQQPKLSIVGPAIEASKYYIEETVLRDMFAKLIANACNASKADSVHPAFVECIKQMNPNDAILLTNLDGHGSLVDYCLTFKQKAGISDIVAEGVHLSQKVPQYSQLNCLSISNLARLNIITYDKLLSGDEILDYSMYENNILYHQCQQTVLANPNIYSQLTLKKYFFNVTAFGKAFKASCL